MTCFHMEHKFWRSFGSLCVGSEPLLLPLTPQTEQSLDRNKIRAIMKTWGIKWLHLHQKLNSVSTSIYWNISLLIYRPKTIFFDILNVCNIWFINIHWFILYLRIYKNGRFSNKVCNFSMEFKCIPKQTVVNYAHILCVLIYYK